MKKVLFAAFAALILMSSCSNIDDVSFTPQRTSEQISFNLGDKAVTRSTQSVVTGTSLPEGSFFGAYGYVKESTDVDAGYIMINGKYDNTGSSSTPYYWPISDDNSDVFVNFVAYYPWTDDAGVVSLNQTTGDFTYHVTADGLVNDDCTDVLIAVAANQSPESSNNRGTLDVNGNVPLTFKHALSLVQFQGKKADYVESVTISEIKFSSALSTEGDIVINTKNNPTIADMVVTNKTNPQTYNFAAQNNDLTDDYQVLSTAMVIPQDVPAAVTIKFDITLVGDGGHIEYRNRTITRTITSGNDDNNNTYDVTTFAAGHKYIYRYYVTADDVNFSITVDDWTNDWWQVWDTDDSGAQVNLF